VAVLEVTSMSLSRWLTGFGILMNLIGTVLLVFSLPTTTWIDPTTRGIYLYDPVVLGSKSDLHFVKDLFYKRAIKEKNFPIRLSLFLLIFGVALQIIGLYLDC
jgi:hypothetical protein